MKFYPKLYVGEKVRSVKRIKRRLGKRFLITKAYIITFAAGEDLLEIYDANVFAQKYYRRFPRMIVGIAADYDEAVELVLKITRECLEQRGDCSLKEYLNEELLKEGSRIERQD